MSKIKAAVHNLGCKVNAYETEAVIQLLGDADIEVVPFNEKADVYIVNTCTVTAVADKKTRQILHRARKTAPSALIVAMGCYAENHKKEIMQSDDADIIIGNNRKSELVSIINSYVRSSAPEGFFADDDAFLQYENLEISKSSEHTRGFIKVQDGCNQFCTYCIIPFARGRIRSRNPEKVLPEAERLAESGVKEIVLTGIHLSSYGRDRDFGYSLADLIERVHEADGIERIRLGSLEPNIIDEDFAKRLSVLPKLCPHFHLSLQSGCDKTLKNMNRAYTSSEYMEKCELLREYFKRPALTTDIIAGFPMETEEDFEESLAFVDKVGFFETHVFPYSKREGTYAAKMPCQLTEKVKKERVKRLLELDERHRSEYLAEALFQETEVLVEEAINENGSVYYAGHTKRYENVMFTSEKSCQNELVRVLPYEVKNGILLAKTV